MKHTKISVIIPVYNGEKCIKSLLDSLISLDYPKDDYEIIVVDNHSTDHTKEIVNHYSVRLLEENVIQSSYAARNKGIGNARYDILAFTDADCIATKEWLKEGIKPITNGEADLVGGKVEFYFSKEKMASELYDSITNMQIEDNIRERNVAKTANLFAKKEIFNKIGLFPDYVKSGGDVQWTNKATKKSFSLVYAPKAIVMHPARSLKSLIKKQYRVGKGTAYIFICERRSLINIIYLILKLLIPPYNLSAIKNKLKNKGVKYNTFNLFFVAYLCDLSTSMGIITSLMKILRYTNRDQYENK